MRGLNVGALAVGLALTTLGWAPLVSMAQKIKESGGQLTMTFRDGTQRLYQTNKRPDRGSPVYYIYKGFLPSLDAYAMEVWRIGMQLVLLPAQTGVEVEVGAQYTVSPARRSIFSSDCTETNCYVQVNAWPSGRLLIKLAHESTVLQRDETLLQSLVPAARVRWLSERGVAFDMPCASPGQAVAYKAATLLKTGVTWKLVPAAPCKADSALAKAQTYGAASLLPPLPPR